MAPPNEPELTTLLSELALMPSGDQRAIIRRFDAPSRRRLRQLLSKRADGTESAPTDRLNPALSEQISYARKAAGHWETAPLPGMTRAAAEALLEASGGPESQARVNDRPSASLLDIAARHLNGALRR